MASSTENHRKTNGARVGLEDTLWQAADKLRDNMNPAEYKHVVLGLQHHPAGPRPLSTLPPYADLFTLFKLLLPLWQRKLTSAHSSQIASNVT
ncbi:MAG: type I restriction-modification system subunit M N-terminal domain-containing protein [Bryobacteraceae bacterium]